jgi:hypothetical protein
MALSLNDIVLDNATSELLFKLGKQDGKKGTDRYSGWQAAAKEGGFDTSQRTPAQERYLDGWFEGAAEKNK